MEYIKALKALKRDFGPNESWPVFLAYEVKSRVIQGSWAVTGSWELIQAGERNPVRIVMYIKHRGLDMIHPWGDQRKV